MDTRALCTLWEGHRAGPTGVSFATVVAVPVTVLFLTVVLAERLIKTAIDD